MTIINPRSSSARPTTVMITDKKDRSINYMIVEAILEYLEREA